MTEAAVAFAVAFPLLAWAVARLISGRVLR